MLIGWGVLIPVGVAIARTCKAWDPMWFHLHRWLGVPDPPRACAVLPQVQVQAG